MTPLLFENRLKAGRAQLVATPESDVIGGFILHLQDTTILGIVARMILIESISRSTYLTMLRCSLVLLMCFAVLPFAAQPLAAQQLAPAGKLAARYQPPTINMRLFANELAMANTERDEYAGNLGAYAAEVVQAGKGNEKSLEQARRVLALALHLSPRNKRSNIINAQLKRGIIPAKVAADYGKDVFAKLLLTRATLLKKQDGPANALLARYFVSLAADMDPRNEDALYEVEMNRIDHGELSWTNLTQGKLVLPRAVANDDTSEAGGDE